MVLHFRASNPSFYRTATVIALVCAIAVATAAAFWIVSRSKPPRAAQKVIVLGIDGLDPDLLEQYVHAGALPHFAALIEKGSFVRLGTSIPPQSPVAWSNLITGTNPGTHGIFDFIHRDPATMQPYLSMARVTPSKHAVHLGGWVFPLTSGRTELLRHGKAFWQFLDERKIPSTVFRIPVNFPPVKTSARTFAGMGTPDMLGTYGTFSFYSADPQTVPGAADGGRIIAVEMHDDSVAATLGGPANNFRKGNPETEIPFTVDVDPTADVARVTIQEHQFLLKGGEWSPWIRLRFRMVPWLVSVSGICRFYLKQAHPYLELYVTPINLDPAQPALPLSTPPGYSRELARDVGEFYTQGIAEDTKALTAGVFDDQDYLTQARMVLAERRRIFDLELGRFHTGLFFFYFSAVDQNSHMFWRAMDPHHPAYSPALAEKFGGAIEDSYRQMDDVLGEAMAHLDSKTTLLVLSDHGFAPFYRSFNLNTWLLQSGYLALKEGVAGGDFFGNVDWSHTRAYGLGLNGLYLNLRGRERYGTVEPGAEASALEHELAARLLAVEDPANGERVITRVDLASDAYSGPEASHAPDLIVGYNRGYRVGWSSVLGGFSAQVIEDNAQPWSGDHCMDFTKVPGVLLSNHKIRAASPSLTDIAPTILADFGIAKPAAMHGSSVFASTGEPGLAPRR